MLLAKLKANIPQDFLYIFPGFPQTAKVVYWELEHAAHLQNEKQSKIFKYIFKHFVSLVHIRKPSQNPSGL